MKKEWFRPALDRETTERRLITATSHRQARARLSKHLSLLLRHLCTLERANQVSHDGNDNGSGMHVER